ncbi:MAG: ABC transporter ATP-binding protein [Candidatus Magasanikbacteria bacterium]
MLQLNNVSKQFGDVTAVDDISFSIEEGEVVGFLGPNGAGKTTTMEMVASLLDRTSGEITFNGKDVEEDPLNIKQNLGFLPEDNPLYEDMLVSEYLDFAADSKDLSGTERKQALNKAIEATGIEDMYYKPISEISRGYKQRVGLAQAIMHKPEILILDEPTQGLDPNQRVEIRDLIKDLGEDKTVILSTHVLPEATATCDRLIIIDQGKIVADDSTEQLQNRTKSKSIVTLGTKGLEDKNKLIDEIEAIEKINHQEKIDEDKDKFEIEAAQEDIELEIFDLAAQQDWKIWELHQEEFDLEHIFRDLTTES